MIETPFALERPILRAPPPSRGICGATTLTGTRWRYLKMPQALFEQLQAATLTDLIATSASLR